MPNNVTQIMNTQLIAQYQANGLTSISNNKDIMPRDKAGNVLISADTSSIAYLVIDPVTNLYTMKSALDLFDTQFKYFSFPVTDVTTDTTNVDLDTTDFESSLLRSLIEQDLTIAYIEDDFGQPVGYRRMNTSYSSTWFTNGSEQRSGLTTLPFIGGNQLEPGRFIIDDNIVDAIRNSNKTIRFDIQMQCDVASPIIDPGPPVIKSDTGFILKLNRFSKINGSARSFNPDQQNYRVGNSFPLLKITYILNPNDIVANDVYEVQAVSGNPSWYLREQTLWKISVVDDDGRYGGIFSSENTTNTTIVDNRTI